MSTGNKTAASGCSSSVGVNSLFAASSDGAPAGSSRSSGAAGGGLAGGLLGGGVLGGGVPAGGVPAEGGVPAGGVPCCATELTSHAASTAAGAANLNQRMCNQDFGTRLSSLQIARDAKAKILAPVGARAARGHPQVRHRRAAPARAAH